MSFSKIPTFYGLDTKIEQKYDTLVTRLGQADTVITNTFFLSLLIMFYEKNIKSEQQTGLLAEKQVSKFWPNRSRKKVHFAKTAWWL